MFNRKQRFAVAVLTATALLASGCAAGNGTPAQTDAATNAPTEPVEGGVLNAILISEPRNLDPGALQNNNRAQALIGNALYGELLTTDPDTGAIIPGIAESFTTSDGGTTFELKLRDDVAFSDGSAFDAAAVEYNWNRAKNPEMASNALQDASSIDTITVVDASTLTVTLVQPTPRYGNNVALSPLNWVASPAAVEAGAESFDANPVGAGPFVLDEWARGGTLSLVANDEYYDAPKPYLDGLDVKFSGDGNQRLNALTTETADLTMIDNWGVAAKAAEADLQVVQMPISGGQYIALNMTAAPFDDERARQAVSAALDLEAFNLIVNDGTGELATYLFSDGHPLENDVRLNEYDPKLAQKLFDELADEGNPVSFTFTTFQGSENLGEAFQSLLSVYDNVTVEVAVAAWADTGKVLGQKQFQATIAAASFQEPDTLLPRAFLSTSRRNSTGINDPELDAAIRAGSTATSTEDRQEAYVTASERLAAVIPGIWYQREPLIAVATTNVGGIELYGQGSLIASELWLGE